jgi:hypothetical protein
MTALIIGILLSYGITCSPEMAELLAETMCVESDAGQYNTQWGGGPALGIYQMEPSTYQDLNDNYIKYNPQLWEQYDADDDLMDPCYATLIAYIQYTRLRGHYDIETRADRAELWKDKWNTHLGKGTIKQYIDKSNKYLGEE